MSWTGFSIAIASAVCNGTFGVFQRIDNVKTSNVSPWLFNFYACIAAGLSGLLVWTQRPVFLSLFGLLSGLLFVASIGCSFVAIQHLGSVAAATGVWCGTAMVVSFLWGSFAGGSGFHLASAAALVVMVACIVGIVSVYNKANSEEGGEHTESLQGNRSEDGGPNVAIGVLAGVTAGIFGGLILAPMQYAYVQGISYLPCMAVGILIFCPLSLFMHSCARSGKMEGTQWRVAAVPALASGLVWNLGNALSMVATRQVGLEVAYPIMQCGLFVAGIWGMILFNELPGKANRLNYMLFGLLLVCGGVILSRSQS